MRKGINLLWVGFVFLNIVIVGASLLDCVKYVPTGYEGLPIYNNELYCGLNGDTISLPDPTFENLFEETVCGCLLCSVIFFFRSKVLNIIGTLIALLQSMRIVFIIQIKRFIEELFEPIGCAIGELHGEYHLTFWGGVVAVLCCIMYVFSLVLTVQYAKEKKIAKGETS